MISFFNSSIDILISKLSHTLISSYLPFFKYFIEEEILLISNISIADIGICKWIKSSQLLWYKDNSIKLISWLSLIGCIDVTQNNLLSIIYFLMSSLISWLNSSKFISSIKTTLPLIL